MNSELTRQSEDARLSRTGRGGMVKARGIALAIVALAALVSGPRALSDPADWPRFRGPELDGVSHEKGLKLDSTEPLKLAWEREIGSAFSSFACVGGKIYTCGTVNGKQTLLCLDAKTGEEAWKTTIEKDYPSEHGSGTRGTPTVDDGLVYILGGHGRLLCVDATTGKKVWDRRFKHAPRWGYSGSVLIEANLAVATAGNKSGSIAAFDKKTGKPVWKCGDDPAGYATPYPFTFNEKRYVVGFTGVSAIIAELATGRQVLRIPWKTAYDVNAASPIFHDGHLFLSSGYTTGAALLKLRSDGDALGADEVWRDTVLMNKFQSCILREGKLYASDQKALKCVDFMTGKEAWNIRRSSSGNLKHGTLVMAEGHLLFLTEAGELQIAKATPDGFLPGSKAEILSGRCWTVPVLYDGHLYARNLERVVCFDMRR